MGWRIVKQPNGKLARFSDIVDNFTHINMTKEEALEVCREHLGRRDAEEKVQRGIEDHKPWQDGVPGSGLERWNDCIKTIQTIHGKKELNKVLKAIEKGNAKEQEDASKLESGAVGAFKSFIKDVNKQDKIIKRADAALKDLLSEDDK